MMSPARPQFGIFSSIVKSFLRVLPKQFGRTREKMLHVMASGNYFWTFGLWDFGALGFGDFGIVASFTFENFHFWTFRLVDFVTF